MFAIMRCKKLKSMGNASSSLKHNFREQETLNADPERTPDNEHLLAENRSQAMGNLRDKLPEKRRKDAVVAVEYLMTASPEFFESATDEQQQEFFKQSLDWLRNKYGADNVIAASIHRDERTPHMAAYVVPLTSDGRLSAKEFIGNRQTMKDDQTTFAKAVEHLGLQRGIEGSKAKHQTIQSFYNKLNNSAKPISITEDAVKPRKAFLGFGGESHSDVAERLSKSLTRSIQPVMAKALAYDELFESKKALKESLEQYRENNDRSRKSNEELAESLIGFPRIPDEIQGKIRDSLALPVAELFSEIYEKYQMDFRLMYCDGSNPKSVKNALDEFEKDKRESEAEGAEYPGVYGKALCAKQVMKAFDTSSYHYGGNSRMIDSLMAASGTYPAPKDTPEKILMRNPHNVEKRQKEVQARAARQQSIGRSRSSGGMKM